MFIQIKFMLFVVMVLPFISYSQITATNDGLALTVEAGLTATIEGHFVNQTRGADLGTIANAGTITLTHNWTNNSANTVFSSNAGSTHFLGTVNAQTIGGTNGTSFYDLTLNNTFGTGPELTLSQSTIIKNAFTMTAGSIDLTGNTLTVGLDATNPGSISHSEVAAGGVVYGGTLIRYFAASTIADGSLTGFFPMGTSSLNYFPIYLSAPAVAPGTGGTISVGFSEAAGTTAVAVMDDINIETRNNSFWNVAAGGGLAGGTYNMRVRGTAMGTIADVNHLRLMLAAAVVGSPGANGGTTAFPIVNRTGLSLANLSNNFYIGSTNAAASPLPVDLLYFAARKFDSEVLIEWRVASQFNVKYFEVQYSVDAINWKGIGQVLSEGDSEHEEVYQLNHPEPKAGLNYYRLKTLDWDGAVSYSSIDPVIFSAESKMLVFPTISRGQPIQIAITQQEMREDDGIDILVHDAAGNLIHSSEQTRVMDQGSVTKVLSSNLFPTAGVYFVSARWQGKLIGVERFVIF